MTRITKPSNMEPLKWRDLLIALTVIVVLIGAVVLSAGRLTENNNQEVHAAMPVPKFPLHGCVKLTRIMSWCKQDLPDGRALECLFYTGGAISCNWDQHVRVGRE
jgi:hypothetical protein